MYSFDASSMIHVWDNYPIENSHFDSLWNWFAERVKEKEFAISKIALDEVNHKIPKCGKWLKDNDIEVYKLSQSVLSQAQSIKVLLEIEEENYTKGVGENDLFIIAIAKIINSILITEEARQDKLPPLKSNYKIPAVCNLPEVNVRCVNFIDILKQQ